MNQRAVFRSLVALGAWLAASASADSGSGHMGAMGAHMHADPHMVLTEARAATAEDLRRGREILAALRGGIEKFQDPDAAIGAGYQPFLPTVPQEVYHFVSRPETAREYGGAFDAARPGSLLYVKQGSRHRLVGAMYSASQQAALADLDRRVPLGLARWHAHVNVCLPKGVTLADLVRGDIGAGNPHLAGMLDPERSPGLARIRNDRLGFMADGRFGFAGKIAEREGCDRAGGDFIPRAWGWMVHVYPYESSLDKVFAMHHHD